MGHNAAANRKKGECKSRIFLVRDIPRFSTLGYVLRFRVLDFLHRSDLGVRFFSGRRSRGNEGRSRVGGLGVRFEKGVRASQRVRPPLPVGPDTKYRHTFYLLGTSSYEGAIILPRFTL